MPTCGADDNTLPELARLLNVWAEHGLVATSEKLLVRWARQTAARAADLLRPESAIHLLTALGLADRGPGALLQPAPAPDPALPTPNPACSTGSARRSPCKSSASSSSCVSSRLRLQKALSYVALEPGELTLRWATVPRQERGDPGWVWLQQLGLMTHEGSRVTFDAGLRPFVLDTPPARRRVSLAELDERLRLQRERADLAEEHVLGLERERLRAAGMDELADETIRVSVDDVMAGFDILSFDLTGAAACRGEVFGWAAPLLCPHPERAPDGAGWAGLLLARVGGQGVEPAGWPVRSRLVPGSRRDTGRRAPCLADIRRRPRRPAGRGRQWAPR